ncbi:MAG: dephospho-CoA kinase [Haloplasmataceae bacterium]|jgi:dephospho-CoA kinase|nr:dephospho-CoA kinase [Haloplasmataceae bacterium]
MAIIIGLTGGIATGKSTVSQMFKQNKIPVIDADIIAREVCEMNEPAYLKIVETFGKDVLMCTGHLNRKKLGSIVFNNREKLQKLNEIIHPEVKKVIQKEINKFILMGTEYIVLDVPLLFESNFDKLCDITLVVFTNENTQIERLMNRDNFTNKEEAIKRIKAQMDIHEKLVLSDYKIDNSMSILETRKQFDSFMKKLKTNEN